MKPFPFDYARPKDLREAGALLARGGDGARVLAGGQSLGPMLNFRLARPSLLVAIHHLPELRSVEETKDAVTLGACVTHAAIADGRTPDIGDRILGRIAGGIAYRAVRNRGTVGGSLAHADPAADWLCTLIALGATVLTWRPGGGRAIPLGTFAPAAFRTVLEPGEIVQAVRIPRPSEAARWGYYKACRKPGEFAFAMAAALVDASGGLRRAVIGAVGASPVVLEGERAVPDGVDAALAESGLDAIERRMQAVALKRALAQAAA
jgi:aerobic carbon-monoxide dehydrogenase medium subunit